MDTADHHQPVRRVPWIGAWGFFGISWFALLVLLIPAAVGAMQFAERHTVEYADTQTEAHRTGFMVVGAVIVTLFGVSGALFAGFLTYVSTARRWYTPPTAMFVLAAIGISAFAWLGLSLSTQDERAAAEARANFDRITEENRETARRQIEADGYASVGIEESERAIQGLRDVAETVDDPNERAVYLIGAEIGGRINELMSVYNSAVEPFLANGITEIPNSATEDNLLATIEVLEESRDANAGVIAYIERIPAILKIEFAKRTDLDASSRAVQADVFLEEMSHDDILVVRNAEQRYLDACLEQVTVLLDTHGLWENTPEGFLFAEGVDDVYIERFNAAFQAIHEAIADQSAAQGRVYNTTPASIPATEPTETQGEQTPP